MTYPRLPRRSYPVRRRRHDIPFGVELPPQSEALDRPRYAVVVLDVGARWRDVYPSAETDAAEERLAPSKPIVPSSMVKSSQFDLARALPTAER